MMHPLPIIVVHPLWPRRWESSSQEPWCYVGAACRGATAGSFGRRHEACAAEPSAPLPPDPDRRNTTGYDALDAGGGASGAGGQRRGVGGEVERMPRPFARVDGEGWRPRAACPCSGYTSAHGFGAHCRGWEAVGQVPWTCLGGATSGHCGLVGLHLQA